MQEIYSDYPRVTVTNGNRHPQVFNAIVQPSRRPPAAASYMRPSCRNWSNSAADHAARVTYAGHSKRNRYQPAPPWSWSRRPTRRGPRPARHGWPLMPSWPGHPLPWSSLAVLAEKMRPAVTVRRYNRLNRRGGRVELVGRVNLNADRP